MIRSGQRRLVAVGITRDQPNLTAARRRHQGSWNVQLQEAGARDQHEVVQRLCGHALERTAETAAALDDRDLLAADQDADELVRLLVDRDRGGQGADGAVARGRQRRREGTTLLVLTRRPGVHVVRVAESVAGPILIRARGGRSHGERRDLLRRRNELYDRLGHVRDAGGRIAETAEGRKRRHHRRGQNAGEREPEGAAAGATALGANPVGEHRRELGPRLGPQGAELGLERIARMPPELAHSCLQTESDRVVDPSTARRRHFLTGLGARRGAHERRGIQAASTSCSRPSRRSSKNRRSASPVTVVGCRGRRGSRRTIRTVGSDPP